MEKLIVPRDAEVRKLMRNHVKMIVQSEHILPPANLEQLNNIAKALIGQLDLSTDYLNFALVLSGNEVWRKTIKATPFNRRLLLLPQCIRNKDKCKGEFDHLGLICNACKSCNIDSILNTAEALGYNTLVAEGTSTVITLVEEGLVDTIIGVSCMPVLERSFRKVSNVAVPVMGIPLLFDGCENTELDYNWLMEELEVFEEDTDLQPISVSLIKNEVMHFFTHQNAKPFFSNNYQADEIALNYLLSGGGRMRPLLSALSYKAYSATTDKDNLLILSLLIECFHKASLIHDDIEDNTGERYNQPALHIQYGIPLAINVGDYLLGKGYEMLTKLKISSDLLTRCLSIISQSHIGLTQGQGDDILFHKNKNKISPEELFNIFSLKTGEAIKTALLAGAVVGNANNSEIDTLSEFSEKMGIAFQIKDDIEEYNQPYENKKTADFPVLSVLLNQVEPNSNSFENSSEFEKLVSQFDIVEKAENILNKYISEANDLLDKLENKKMRLAMYRVMGKIFKQYNIEA